MRRKLLSTVALIMILSLLAGCTDSTSETAPATLQAMEETEPEVTELQPDAMDVDTLIWKVQSAVANSYATTYTDNMRLDTRMGTSGFSMRVGIELTADITLSNYPFGIYVNMDSVVTMADAVISDRTQSYFQAEDGKPMVYAYSEAGDFWYKYQAGEKPSDVLGSYYISGYPPLSEKENVILAPETEFLDEKEAYVLSCTYSGYDMYYYIEECLASILGEISPVSVDMSTVQIPTVYYIDAETFTPIGFVMDFEGIESVINQIIEGTQGNYGAQSSDFEVEVTEFHREVWNIGYDSVAVPAVPDEGISRSAENTFDQFQAAGHTV